MLVAKSTSRFLPQQRFRLGFQSVSNRGGCLAVARRLPGWLPGGCLAVARPAGRAVGVFAGLILIMQSGQINRTVNNLSDCMFRKRTLLDPHLCCKSSSHVWSVRLCSCAPGSLMASSTLCSPRHPGAATAHVLVGTSACPSSTRPASRRARRWRSLSRHCRRRGMHAC